MIVHMLAVYGLVERGGVHYSAASFSSRNSGRSVELSPE
jgi:hypothetical protein